MNKKLIVLFLIIIIAFGILIRTLSLNKDFIAEETEFIKPALAIANTGHPTYYHSEQQPIETALAHPPMYIFLLSLIFKISTSEIAARAINIIFSILIAVLIFVFCSRLIKSENSKIIGLIASAFFLINFYILSSSIQIDIDILSTFFVFTFVFFILLGFETKKNYPWFFAGISMFFGLANRYPIMIITYVFIGGFFLLNKNLRKNVWKYFSAGLISVLVFILIWLAYTTFVEPGKFFSFISHNLEFGAEQFYDLKIYIGSFILNISQLIRLVTLPGILLIILSWIYFLKKKTLLTNILLLYVIPVFLFFFFIPRPAFGYPRYFISIFPGISILLSLFIYENLKNFKLDKIKIITIGLGFIASLILLILLNPQPAIYMSNGLIKALNFPDFCFHILASLPIILVFFIKKERKNTAILILIFLLIAYSIYFGLQLTLFDSHIKETANYIKANTNSNEIIISPKAIGYYLERRFYVNDNNKPYLDFSMNYLKTYIEKSFKNPEMDDEFFWPGGFFAGTSFYGINPSQEDLKKASYVVLYHPVNGYVPETKIGVFYIYNIKEIKNEI